MGGADARGALADGLAAILRHQRVRRAFPPEVLDAANEAARRPLEGVDRRDLELVTLDPVGTNDLDQAMAITAAGDDLVLSYAIADVGFFVDRGGAIETEAWRRGGTIDALDEHVPLYPPALSEGAASLQPGRDRPAVVLTVDVGADGTARLRAAEAAVVRSRRQLAYETMTPAELPELLPGLARRVESARRARGAIAVEFPEPRIAIDANGLPVLARRAPDPAERANADASLAANLAVATALCDGGHGLFRVLAEPDAQELRALRQSARTLGVDWPADAEFHRFVAGLRPDTPARVAFLVQARRAGGAARYAPYDESTPPWHASMAAPYVHATAPLRRLADRYVLDGLLERRVPTVDWIALAGVMQAADTRRVQIERGVLALVEAIILTGRVGEVFAASVVDVEGDKVRVELVDPPVRARVRSRGHAPGDVLHVRLTEADASKRRVRFAVA